MAQQNPPEISYRSYLLGQYLVDPVSKVVSKYRYWEEDNIMNGSYESVYCIEVDSTIHYATTCLYVNDFQVEFKEHYFPAELKAFTKDGDVIDMSAYTPFGKYYKKDNEYYYLARTVPKPELKKLEVKGGINFESLTSAGGNFYYDEKGLYFIDGDYQKRLTKVAEGNRCIPMVRQTYCEYNGTAYQAGLAAIWKGAVKINADPKLLKEMDMHRNGKDVRLTDGTRVFFLYDPYVKEIPGVGKWQQLSSGEMLKVVDSSVYLSTPIAKSDRDILFASPEGFFTVNTYFGRLQKYNKVLIANHATHEYEEIDTAQFTLHQQGFYTYKGKHCYQGMLITDSIDVPNLRYVKNALGNDTGWLTDGKVLINLKSMAVAAGDGIRFSVSFGRAATISNIKQLKVVDDDLLVDGDSFYSYSWYNHGIQVIPISRLGFEVKINVSTYAYPAFYDPNSWLY